MGLESVELIMAWEESFQITILDEEVAHIGTPRAVVELICRKLAAKLDHTAPYCLTQRSFYRLRRAFVRVVGHPKEIIRPGIRLSKIVPRRNRRVIGNNLP